MLDEIRARNIGLIADATITPGTGLTVITGETGTGKTLMLGALRLVTGGHASRGTIGPHDDTAEVAARFVDEGNGEFVVRRVLTDKRSRSYLNGIPATAKEISAAVGSNVSIVGQHDQHTLSTSEGVRILIDGMFNAEQRQLLATYESAYRDLRTIEAEMDSIGSDRKGLEREVEMIRFQVEEIADAGFGVGDEEVLRSTLDRLRHTEEISADMAVAVESLGDAGVGEAIGNAIAALDRVQRLDPGARQLAETLGDTATAINEMTSELNRYIEGIESDPSALAASEQRLADLSSLKRKYGDTITEIDSFAKAAQQRSEEIVELLEAAESLGERHTSALSALGTAAMELTNVRNELAVRASEGAVLHLQDLGFGQPGVSISLDQKEPGATGADRFSVLFASDDSLVPAPIGSIASGGELSRLVLALTLACGAADTSVVAFDEIDAGVGGSTALAMGEKLAALGRTRQVLCVTHLPQVAVHGDHHYTVERTGTTATIMPIQGDTRTAEIARMLAGLETSESAMSHAEELLERARRVKASGLDA